MGGESPCCSTLASRGGGEISSPEPSLHRELPIPSRCQPICCSAVLFIFSECQSLPTAANTEPPSADSDVSVLFKFSEYLSPRVLS